MKALICKHRIRCDLKPGVLHVAARAALKDHYRHRIDKLERDYAYQGVRYVAQEELRQMLGTERYVAAELWQDGAHLHPHQ